MTLYHIVIEASLAQPGQHFICSYLERRDQLPAFRQGMQNISADEQRHIGFGVKLLSDLHREDPVGVPKAVAKLLRDVTRYTAQVLMPPGWDERYVTVFGSTYDEVGVEGLTSMTTKLRSAGLAADTLPGPALLPPGLTPLEVSQRGRTLAKAGVIGVREGPTKRDPETVALLFDTVRRQVNPNHGLKRATTFQWEFTEPDVPTWHLTVNNGSSTVAEGRVAGPGPAPASVLPGLGQHHRPAPGPPPRAGHRAYAPARQPAGAAQADEGVSAGLSRAAERVANPARTRARRRTGRRSHDSDEPPPPDELAVEAPSRRRSSRTNRADVDACSPRSPHLRLRQRGRCARSAGSPQSSGGPAARGRTRGWPWRPGQCDVADAPVAEAVLVAAREEDVPAEVSCAPTGDGLRASSAIGEDE